MRRRPAVAFVAAVAAAVAAAMVSKDMCFFGSRAVSQDALSAGAWHRGVNLEISSQETWERNFTQESPGNTRVKLGSKGQKE